MSKKQLETPQPNNIVETPELGEVDMSKPIHSNLMMRDSFMQPPMVPIEFGVNGLPTKWRVLEINGRFFDRDGTECACWILDEWVSVATIFKPGNINGESYEEFRFHARLVVAHERNIDKAPGKRYTARHDCIGIPASSPIAVKNGKKQTYARLDGKSILTHTWCTEDGMMPLSSATDNRNPYETGAFKKIVFDRELAPEELKHIWNRVYTIPEEPKAPPTKPLRLVGPLPPSQQDLQAPGRRRPEIKPDISAFQ